MKLKYWKPKIIDGSTWVLCSSRRSGKSTFAMFLCAFKGGFMDLSHKVIVMTTGCNSNSWNLIPESDIYIDYQPELLNDILDFQANLMQQGKEAPVITIILDDLLVATSRGRNLCSQYDLTLWRIFSTGRHYNIHLVLISQSISLIGLNFLRNCDYFCWFDFKLKNDKKKLVQILGAYGDENEIYSLIDKPERYHIFILELTSAGYELEEKLQTFKVPSEFLNLKLKEPKKSKKKFLEKVNFNEVLQNDSDSD